MFIRVLSAGTPMILNVWKHESKDIPVQKCIGEHLLEKIFLILNDI